MSLVPLSATPLSTMAARSRDSSPSRRPPQWTTAGSARSDRSRTRLTSSEDSATTMAVGSESVIGPPGVPPRSLRHPPSDPALTHEGSTCPRQHPPVLAEASTPAGPRRNVLERVAVRADHSPARQPRANDLGSTGSVAAHLGWSVARASSATARARYSTARAICVRWKSPSIVPAAELAVAAAASASAAATAAELPRSVAVWWLMAAKVPTRHGREMNAVPSPGGDPISPWTVRTMRPQPAGHNAAPLYPRAPNSAVRHAAEMQVLFHKPPRTPCTAGAVPCPGC